jgi:mannose-1-phosphate guanylyltransferase/phosphomannomutase
VDIRGRVRSFVEKPPREQITGDLANGGILICEQGVLDLVAPGGQSDFGRDVLPKMLAEGKPVFGQPIGPREFIIDMGTPDGYRRAQQAALGYRNYTDPIQMGWIPA